MAHTTSIPAQTTKHYDNEFDRFGDENSVALVETWCGAYLGFRSAASAAKWLKLHGQPGDKVVTRDPNLTYEGVILFEDDEI